MSEPEKLPKSERINKESARLLIIIQKKRAERDVSRSYTLILQNALELLVKVE